MLSSEARSSARRWRGRLPAALLFTCATLAGSAFIAPDARADGAEAQVLAAQLFREGRADMAREDWRSAESKLAASHKLVPAMGTLLNLAVCQARLGKTASAYQAFGEVVREAQNSGRTDRLELANAEMARLKPLLADAVVHVPAAVETLPGFTVTLDGSPLPAQLYETRVNLDPGSHVLAASAKGKRPWTFPLRIQPSEHAELTIPFLSDKPFDPRDVKVSLVVAEHEAKHQTLRTTGFVLLGVGAASLATSLAFGIVAKVKNGQVHCGVTPDGNGGFLCPADQAQASQTANTDATIANVAFGAGLGLAALGVVFVFAARDTGPADDKSDNEEDARLHWKLNPSFDSRGGGLTLGRAF
jgi:hypothetical protein